MNGCRAELCTYWPGEGCVRGVMPCGDEEPDEYDRDDDRCVNCGSVVDHYLGCPDDPNPDYEAEAEARSYVAGGEQA